MITLTAGNGTDDDYELVQEALYSSSIYLPLGFNQAPAIGLLTTTGTFSNGETVKVGESTYTLKTTLAGNYDVLIGANVAASLTNLASIINGGFGAGTTYWADTPPNASSEAVATSTTLKIKALSDGSSGNAIVTTETCSNASFGSGTLTGGVDSYKLSLPLKCPSNRAIIAEPGTVISRLDGTVETSQTVCLENDDIVNGNRNIFWSGMCWDGNGFNQTRVNNQIQAVIKMVNVNNATGENFQLKNPLVFSGVFGGLTNSRFRNVGFFQDRYIANGDGLHFCGGCRGIDIDGYWGMTNDDMISLACYDSSFYTTGFGHISDFNIRGGKTRGGHRGIRLLSASGYHIRGVNIHDSDFECTHGGIIIGNNGFGEGSMISGVRVNNARVKKVRGPSDFGTSEASLHIDCNTAGLTVRDFVRDDNRSDSVVTIYPGFTHQKSTFNGFDIAEAGGGRSHFKLGGTHKNITISDSDVRYTGGSTDGGYLIATYASLIVEKLLLDNVNTDKIQVIVRDSSANNLGIISSVNCNFNVLHTAFYFDNATTAKILSIGSRFRGAISNIVFNGGASLSDIAFQNSIVDTAPYIVQLSGTLGVAPKMYFAGLESTSITTAPVGISASQSFSLNTVDYPFDRSILNPLTNDIVLDLTNGLQRWSGSAWVSP